MSRDFNPDLIKALCHRDTPREDLIEFNRILSNLSFHRAAEYGEYAERAQCLAQARQFIVDHKWHYDHIRFFFEQGNGSYLVTPDEFYSYVIAEYYRLKEMMINAA